MLLSSKTYSFRRHQPFLDIGLTVSNGTERGGAHDDTCGEDPNTGVHELFQLSWPTPPKLESSQQGIPLKEIFGHRHAFTLLLRNSDVGHPKEVESKFTPPGSELTTELKESARNKAIVRLIREGK